MFVINYGIFLYCKNMKSTIKNNEIRLGFGKYKGMLLFNILKTDPDYIKWAVSKSLIKLPKSLKL